MSAYENVVGGRLRLKGKPLHVKADGFSKKKKKYLHCYPHSKGENTGLSIGRTEEDFHETEKDGTQEAKLINAFEDPSYSCRKKIPAADRKLELKRLAKIATKSHRDRVQEFNQYLANLTEHYDIPKVGPG